MVKIIYDIMILRHQSYKPVQKLWEFFERWASHGTSKWHASIKIVFFKKIHIPRSGKFEGWIGKSLNARDKSILYKAMPLHQSDGAMVGFGAAVCSLVVGSSTISGFSLFWGWLDS